MYLCMTLVGKRTQDETGPLTSIFSNASRNKKIVLPIPIYIYIEKNIVIREKNLSYLVKSGN